jgi:hypothetical protein
VNSPGVLVLQTGRRRGSAGAVVVIVIVVRPGTEQRLCKHNGDVQLDGSVMVVALWDMTPSRLAVSIIRADGGGSKFFRNVGGFASDYTASYSTRQPSAMTIVVIRMMMMMVVTVW